MYRFLNALFVATFLLLPFTGHAQTADVPWKSLFNGKNFKGWMIVHRGKQAHVWVADGQINGNMLANTPQHTFITTKKQYADFILEGDCKLDGDLHTGFLFRLQNAPDTATIPMYGYQIKIDPTSRRWTGGIFDDFGKTWHWLYTLKDDERARVAFRMNEWNTFRIEALGDTMKVWINGTPTAHLINGKYRKGNIALKIHSMGNTPEKEATQVHYKNLRIIDKNARRYALVMDLVALKAD